MSTLAKKISAKDAHDDEEESQYRPIDLQLGRRMLGLLAPYKSRYIFGLFLGLSMIALELQGPKFMEALVNHVTAYAGDANATTARTTQLSYVSHIVDPLMKLALADGPRANPRNAIITAFVTIVLWACVLASTLVLQRYTILVITAAGERVQFGIRKRLFAHLQRLSMSYYDKTKLGRIISRCTSDVSSMREINVWGLYTILSNLLMMIFAAVMLAMTDLRLFAAVAPLGVLLFVLNRVYLKKSAKMNQIAREGWTRVSTNLAENITGMRVVAAFNRQEPNLGVFNRLQVQNTENNVRLSRLNGVYQPALQLIGFAGQVVILTYGAYLVVVGKMGVGAVVAGFMYWSLYFINPILNFGTFYNTLLMAMAGAERIFHLLDTAPDVQDAPGAKPLPRIDGNVRFENVTFGYDATRAVLHDVNFEAMPGQTIALVGATGSGKSSIISLIARFYQPQAGKVLVDGHDIRHVTGESLHRQMGLVLQVNYLFTGTVMENIRYSAPNATDEDVKNAARAIGSYGAIMSLADGFQTDVGERGANMSLGQRQLICFTRAFLADPRIFMLDEATSAVDTATEMLVQSSLEKLLAGRTTFIVAHRLSTIMKADNILVIDAGRIIERGTHQELLNANGRYARLYEQFVHHAV